MSTYEISKSSLLSLKAEILRKQDELSKTKAENNAKIRNLKKQSPLEIKNKGLESRQKNDIVEDEDLLRKSKAALEAKSKLYEKLSNSNTNLTEDEIEFNRRYLVRFDKKKKKSKLPDLPPEDSEDDIDQYPDDEEINQKYGDDPRYPDEEWVEYTDCLGRTRTCLRKDLEYLKSKDQDLQQIVDEKRKNRGEDVRPPTPPPPPQSTEDQQKSEITEENELLSFDMRRQILREQWDKEEDKLRNKSDIHYQDILFDEARTHGVSYYAFSKDDEERARQQEALKKLRKETEQQQKRAQELKAVREKQLAARIKAAKNRKRARMGLPPEEDEPEVSTPVVTTNDEPKEDSGDDEEEKKKINKMRKKHIRPWDIGKEGVKEHYEYTQEEWVDKKRRERPTEFAPPSAYRGDDDKQSSSSSSKKDRHKEKRRSDETIRRRRKSKERIVELGNKKMEPVSIINECSDDSDNNDRINQRGSGVEIPPPVLFDYYCDKKPKIDKKSRTNVGDSIEAGLKYLREQIEKNKSNNSKQSDDNIFFS